MDISLKDKIYGLSLIWRDAEYNFPFWNIMTDLDWDSAYLKAFDAVSKTTDIKDYYLELMKYISLLNDGHTFVEFPKYIYDDTKYYPIKMKYQDGKHIIVGLDKKYDVPLLSEVYAVNDVPIDQYMNEKILPYCWHSKKTSAYANLYSLWPLRSKGLATNAYSLISFIDNNDSLKISASSGEFTLSRAEGAVSWNEINIKPFKADYETLYSSDFLEIKITGDNIARYIHTYFYERRSAENLLFIIGQTKKLQWLSYRYPQ